MLFVFFISLVLVLFIYAFFYFMSYKSHEGMESMSPYECGFDVGSVSRMMFSYRFFLISILFMVFDVEIVLLIPFAFFLSGPIEVCFVVVLVGGLMYEYMYGSLEWL